MIPKIDDTEYFRRFSRYSNRTHEQADREFKGMLATFMALGLLLILATWVCIEMRWSPGEKHQTGWVEITSK